MKGFDKGLAKVEKVLCSITLIVMLAITFFNVCSRFIFHVSFSFAEEITTGLFVLCSLMGSAVGVRKKSHLGLNVVTDRLPQKTQHALLLGSNMIATMFCGYMTYLGITMTMDEFNSQQITASLQWPEWIFGMMLPLGFAFVTLRFLMEVIWNIRHEEAGDYE